MKKRAESRPRRGAQYSNVLPGIALLAALGLMMVGLTAVRLGLVVVDVRLGPRLTGAAAAPAAVTSKPTESTPKSMAAMAKPIAAALRPAAVEAALAVPAAPAAVPAREPIVTQPAAQPVATDATTPGAEPLETVQKAATMVAAKPSKALASAAGTAKRVAECATTVATAVNVDPTAGELSGAHGLPDQVSYFKAWTKKACRPVASNTPR